VPVYALGVNFSYNLQATYQMNFDDKLTALKKLLNIWSIRDLSILGRITIVKSLALAKIIFMSSVLATPKSFIEDVNKTIFKFIWKGKPPKIKKSTLTADLNQGGLKMTDFTLFDKALKASWIKRFEKANQNSIWKIIPLHFLQHYGGEFVLKCNYDVRLLKLSNLPLFYTQTLTAWQELRDKTINSTDILEEFIWNNRNILQNGSVIYKENWKESGVLQIKHQLNTKGGFLSYENFVQKYKLKCNFLEYYSILSSIPKEWKTRIKKKDTCTKIQSATKNITPSDITCKKAYNILLNAYTKKPTAEPRILGYGFKKDNLYKQFIRYLLRLLKKQNLLYFNTK